ncbi:MAG: hypothetical protein F6J93_00515 [Oscillatoria sp. SIO1A7]|nr:hypothetical protein [Oscillatoria sp. SIO1A7]
MPRGAGYAGYAYDSASGQASTPLSPNGNALGLVLNFLRYAQCPMPNAQFRSSQFRSSQFPITPE